MSSTLRRSLSIQPGSRGPDASGDGRTRLTSLPPTRAAHRAVRSRGAFLGGRGERGLIRGLVSLLFLAATAVSLIALAPRAIDAPVVVSNPAFELVAAASRLPASHPAPHHP
jgi:hypothetical protein